MNRNSRDVYVRTHRIENETMSKRLVVTANMSAIGLRGRNIARFNAKQNTRPLRDTNTRGAEQLWRSDRTKKKYR